MEPTKEQWLWEQCGFRKQQLHELPLSHRHEANLGWWYPDGKTSRKYLLDIDLNNLFKYAVPLLEKKLGYKEAYKLLIRWITEIMDGRDPADTLFWVIYEALGGKQCVGLK